MRMQLSAVALVLLMTGMGVTVAYAQDEGVDRRAAIQAAERQRQVPIEVVVTVSRYLDDELVSSSPYTLAINANGLPTNIRMGARVPVPNPMFTPRSDVPNPGPMVPSNYENIGVNLDGQAATTGDGLFYVMLGIEDISLAFEEAEARTQVGVELPVFRTFQASNEVVLRDGGTVEFWSATDRTSGEVIRVTAALRVLP